MPCRVSGAVAVHAPRSPGAERLCQEQTVGRTAGRTDGQVRGPVRDPVVPGVLIAGGAHSIPVYRYV
ncbi:hypothetical protein Kpho02_22630 [Kitasatospora phosalacinea]|uniref:Uncharacterized protein n=1 Tax=Kitasatospora phosalacinea TaxID=2065 RepID=A0A9W6UZR5_9ACTN|nr:hypothetical protein Kpho02_22630 [Kitasatospora phosalacinea]